MPDPITEGELSASKGRTVYSKDGQALGDVEEIFNDIDTDKPEWIAIPGDSSRRLVVPARDAAMEGENVQVPYSEEQVLGSPEVSGDEISQELEAQLYAHYGIEYSESRSDSGLPEDEATGDTGAGGIRTGDVEGGEFKEHDLSEEGAAEGKEDLEDHDEVRVTRSEEELATGTREREAGRVGVTKSVETERVQTTVPKRREEVNIERVPASEDTGTAEIGEDEISVPVVEEEIVLETKPVVKEELRIKKEAVTEEQTVEADVRKERVDVDEQTERT